MSRIIPPSLLFQYQPLIQHSSQVPRRSGALLKLDSICAIFVPSTLNRDSNPFELRLAWNVGGLGVSIAVAGKKQPVLGSSGDLRNSDRVQLMIDTRHTASVHRATSYCTSVLILPSDSEAQHQPTLSFPEIAQQREVQLKRSGEKCRLWCDVRPGGYLLEVWLPASELSGFAEAADIRRLGFYCIVHDTELGELPLSVGDDFPAAFDPSTWLQMELSE